MAPVCITPAEFGDPTAPHGVVPVAVKQLAPTPTMLSPLNMSSSNLDSSPRLAASNASFMPLKRKLDALRSRLLGILRLSVPIYRRSRDTFEVRVRVTDIVRFWM